MLTSRYSLLRAVAGEDAGGGGDNAGEGDAAAKGDDEAGGDDDGELSTEQLKALKKEAEDSKRRLKELERNNKRLTNEKKSLESEWKRMEELGMTVEEIKELAAEREREREEKEKAAGEWEKILDRQRAKVKETEETWKQKYEQDVGALRKQIEDLTLGHRLRAAIDQIGVREELKEAAEMFHRGRIRREDDPDEPQGFKWLAKYGDAELGLEEYMKIWAENDPQAPAWLKPNINEGAGVPGRSGNGRADRKAKSKMTVAEKAQFIEDHGAERYWKLPD